MITIGTYEEFYHNHLNASFASGLTNAETLPKPGDNDFQQDIQNAYTAYNIERPDKPLTKDEVSYAVYITWADATWGDSASPLNPPDFDYFLMPEQFKTALTSLTDSNGNPVFTATEGTNAVNRYYMDITITIDVVGVLAQYTPPSSFPFPHTPATGTTYISNWIKMEDNHPTTSTGEDTPELNSEGLQPNMTITWTALSKQSGHTIQLKRFGTSNNQNFETLAPDAQQMSTGSPNIWVTKALSSLPSGASAQYMFYLTIDNGGTVFWFDPYIGDSDVT